MFRFVSNCLREVLKQLEYHFGGCSLWFCWILLLQIQPTFSQLQFLHWRMVFSHQPPNSILILEICPLSSVISWQIHGDVVVICQAVNLSPFISLTSCFNVTPLYLSVPVSPSLSLSPRLHFTAAVIYWGKKLILQRDLEPLSRRQRGLKCHELVAGGVQWCRHVARRHMKAWLLPPPLLLLLLHTLWKCDPLDIYFKRPVVPVFAQRGHTILYESFRTFS